MNWDKLADALDELYKQGATYEDILDYIKNF